MRDFSFDFDTSIQRLSYPEHAVAQVIRLEAESVDELADELAAVVRQHYVDDSALGDAIVATATPAANLIAAKLPDPNHVMSGDFGEILAGLVQAASAGDPLLVRDPKKLRLKVDRLKPAPYADVVQFEVPNWPAASAEDTVRCAEVKSKATSGSWDPIGAAVEGSALDRETRLAKSLVWLRERALFDDLGTVSVDLLERFINAVDSPTARREFFAVAVMCATLSDAELEKATALSESTLVVLVVPDLRETYQAVYERAAQSFQSGGTA